MLVEVIAERFRAGGVAQLGHGRGFELPDALSGNAIDLADLIQRAGLAVGEPESQSDDPGFTLGQRGQHGLQVILPPHPRRLPASSSSEVPDSPVARSADSYCDRRFLRRVRGCWLITREFSTAGLACPQSLVPVQSRTGAMPGSKAVRGAAAGCVARIERSVRVPSKFWVSPGTGLRSEMVSVAYLGKAAE